MIKKPTKNQINATPVSIQETVQGNRWFQDLPKEEREEIRAYLRSFKPTLSTSVGIARYWKLTMKGGVSA